MKFTQVLETVVQNPGTKVYRRKWTGNMQYVYFDPVYDYDSGRLLLAILKEDGHLYSRPMELYGIDLTATDWAIRTAATPGQTLFEKSRARWFPAYQDHDWHDCPEEFRQGLEEVALAVIATHTGEK